MPPRSPLVTFQTIVNSIVERIRQVERLYFVMQEFLEAVRFRSYSWQSSFVLTAGLGHKLCTDTNGHIRYARAERSTGDGTSTAELDLLMNGVSIFGTVKPTVPAGEILGHEVPPFNTSWGFRKGDTLQANIINTGGGTGPLRLTLYFSQEPDEYIPAVQP